MNKNFEISIKELLIDEGGYVNDPSDPGGETKYGISKKSYPHVDILNLTVDDAKSIYWKDFWLACGCDILPSGVDYFVFDTAVLHGTSFTLKVIQQAVKCENIDGIIGPKTRAKILYYAKKDANYFLQKVVTFRIDAYRRIVASKPSTLKYFFGWVSRTIENYAFALMEISNLEDASVFNHENCLDKDQVEQFLLQRFDTILNDLPKLTQLRE